MNRTADALRWGSAFVLVVAAFLPASAGVDLFPKWDLDPGRQPIPTTSITPAVMLLLSVLPLFSLAGILLADSLEGRRPPVFPLILGGIGSAGVMAHAFRHGPVGIEHLMMGAPWVGGIGAMLASACLAAHARFRVLLRSLVAGFVAALLAKGLLQVLVEHPATIADFVRHKEAILTSRGWTPGSSSALIYERRLTQPEASGWFGLSNVYATFAAATVAGLIVLAVSAWREERMSKRLIAPIAGAIAGLIALWLTSSKGGAGAAAVGLAAAGVYAIVRARSADRSDPGPAGRATGDARARGVDLSRWIGPAVIVGVLALVALRGVLGEALGERSILFRAFYAVGSLRIWLGHPVMGVGPDGFQSAYASAKPAISPETVVSPHSVLLDWVATLGVLGLAWAALLFERSRDLVCASAPAVSLRRVDIRFIGLAVAAVSLIAAAVERDLATPAVAIARVAGLAGWLALAIGLFGVIGRAGGLIGLAAGTALLAHAQIEVTPVWASSAMLFGLWIGSATGLVGRATGPAGSAGVERTGLALAAGAFLIGTGILAAGSGRAVTWERSLFAAEAVFAPIGELRDELAQEDRRSIERLAGRVSVLLGRAVPPRADAIAAAIDTLRGERIEYAAGYLRVAASARPGHVGTRSATGRLLLEQAERLGPERGVAMLESAVVLAMEGRALRPGSVGMWDWLGVTAERAGALAAAWGEAERAAEWRGIAWEAWGEADKLSPYSVRYPVRMMRLAPLVGEDAGAHAAEAMRRDGLARLDPLAGLTDEERAEVEGVAVD